MTDDSTPPEPPCSCPGPGYCQRFAMDQTPYAHAVCQGKDHDGVPCSAGKSESYRRKWRLALGQVQGQGGQVPAAPPAVPVQPRPQVRPQTQDPAARQPAAALAQVPRPGLGRVIESLLGVTLCSNTRAQIDGWGLRIAPNNRAWLSEYLNRRYSRAVGDAESLIDQALRQLKEQEESGAVQQTSLGVSGDPLGAVPLPGGSPPRPDRGTEGGAAAVPGADGAGVPDHPGVPGVLPAKAGRYRVGPVAAPPTVPARPPQADYPDGVARLPQGDVHATQSRPVTPRKPLTWAVGVTTVPERRDTLLPRTLASLAKAGFPAPRLFVDGLDPAGAAEYIDRFKLDATPRWPKTNGFINWIIALQELYYRNPNADRYAVFQDDILLCRNVQGYLDATPYPAKAYLNLMTFWENEHLAGPGKPRGWVRAEVHRMVGGPTAQPAKARPNGIHSQYGRGALGLVFDRPSVLPLLSHRHFVNRVRKDHPGYDPDRAYRYIDGAVVEAMNDSGFYEYVHNPSLVQHNGPRSTITGLTWGPIATARSFPGEGFDCLTLLPKPVGTGL